MISVSSFSSPSPTTSFGPSSPAGVPSVGVSDVLAAAEAPLDVVADELDAPKENGEAVVPLVAPNRGVSFGGLPKLKPTGLPSEPTGVPEVAGAPKEKDVFGDPAPKLKPAVKLGRFSDGEVSPPPWLIFVALVGGVVVVLPNEKKELAEVLDAGVAGFGVDVSALKG